MAAGVKTAANAANNIIKNKTTLKSIATTVKNVGQNVLDGATGNYRNYTKRLGTNILKSNMSEAQLKSAAKNGMESMLRDTGNKNLIKGTIQGAITTAANAGSKAAVTAGANANKYVANASVKHALKMAPNNKIWGSSPTDMILGKAMAKTDIGFRVGDAIGGGIRDTFRSMKAGQSASNALKAGFTQGGKVRMDRVAGAAFGVGVAGRVATGGGLYRDRYGRVNVPGVPFI